MKPTLLLGDDSGNARDPGDTSAVILAIVGDELDIVASGCSVVSSLV